MAAVNISLAAMDKIRPSIKNGEIHLTVGAVKRIFEDDGNLTEPAILQLTNFKMCDENGSPGTCARGKMYDGAHYYKFFFFSSDLANQLRRDNLIGKWDGANGGELLLVTRTHCSMANKTKTGCAIIVVDEYELLSRGHPSQDTNGTNHEGTPQATDLFRSLKPTNQCTFPWTGTATSGASAPAASRTIPPPRAPAPIRSHSSAPGAGNVIPITAITPYLNKWRICGICTDAEPLKSINTKNGASQVFNFTLTDKDGSAIRIAAFGETATKTASIVQSDCTYYLSNGTVKQANKRWNTTGHDYEITLRNDSEVIPCNEHISRPAFTLKICPLDRLVNHKEETVDVLAVVDKMEPVTDFTSRAGKQMTKRDISLIDRTGTIVTFTLWNEQAREFEDEALSQVIGIKGVTVKEWNGGVSLGSVGGTKWELSPALPEVPTLYEWYRDERPNVEAKTLTASTVGGDSLSRDLRFVGTFTALKLGDEPNLANGRYMSVKARINAIRHENALYQACSNEGCQKKVVAMGNQYHCEKCNSTSDSFKWHYMVSMELADGTGTFWVTIFAKTAEKLFNKPAQELGELKEYDAENYVTFFNEFRLKNYIWRIRAKSETYNEEMRIRYTVYDAQDVNWDKYMQELQRASNALDQLSVY